MRYYYVLSLSSSHSDQLAGSFFQLITSVIGGNKEKVGYYAGLMVRSHSSKFSSSESIMAQDSVGQIISLVTVMYWSRLSDIIGRKPILLLGTAALAVSMVSFGLSKTFWGLVVSRCIFRALNSNAGASCFHVVRNYPDGIVYLGVIKSVVGEITDPSNSADAFALLHVPWSVGSSFG
jgi:MFS family permease